MGRECEPCSHASGRWQAKPYGFQRPIHERQAWLSDRKHDAEFRHAERLAKAEKRYPQAVADFEENWCKEAVLEMNSGV